MAKSESKLKEISYQLSKEFPHKDVKWRVGRLNRRMMENYTCLAYIDKE